MCYCPSRGKESDMKRHLMRLLSILLILSLVLGSGQAVQTSYAATSGVCGDNLTWVLDSGTLTISGTGSMDDYQSSSDQPWYKEGVSKDIKTVVIEDGVTSIGKFAFYGCYGVNVSPNNSQYKSESGLLLSRIFAIAARAAVLAAWSDSTEVPLTGK